MRVNLLIVESDNFFSKNLARRLPDENKWRILFAEHRIEALKIVKRKNVDVVLLGLKDLKKEGLMILKELKNIRPLTEVITINRSDQITLSIEGMKLGAFDDFIVPFDLESLVRRIREAHQKKKENEKTKKVNNSRSVPI
jgi:DNA-binding NtrC family response regulator